MGVQAIKHAALLRAWSGRIAECRSSGKTVKAWCEAEGGINQDILLLGEKDRRRGEPRSKSTGDNPEQYADACESGDAVR